MEFIKRNEIIEKFDGNWGCFLIKVLEIEKNIDKVQFRDKEIIKNLINSKYHFWNGENNPNGLTITKIEKKDNENIERKISGIKFCGQFDNYKIDVENYNKINLNEVEQIFLFEAEKKFNSEFAKNLQLKLKHKIREHINLNEKFYLLNLNTESDVEKISEHHVFSFFIRIIAIAEENDFVKILEFSAD
jgi:hypothetical protein